MLETEALLLTKNLEKKLKKDEFNAKFRFREARREGLVTCASCVHMRGGIKKDEVAICQTPGRLKGVKIAEYSPPYWGIGGESRNIAPLMVCDAYKNSPLPDNVSLPILPEKHAMLLGTQWRDPYHLDAKCPYVVEEARIIASKEEIRGKPGEFTFVDISEWVPGERVRDMCDMPCCERKLEVQVVNPNGYRSHVGIHPNADDPRRWVRNSIIKHGNNSNMTIEEAEAFFDLTKVSSGRRSIDDQIAAVSEYMHKNCNWLGSRPLAEAANPVSFSNRHYFWNELPSKQHPEQFWACDDKLFDADKGLSIPLMGLERIPEGFILCLDTKGVLRHGMYKSGEESPSLFRARGILKPMQDQGFLSKGVSHFMDIREVGYHDHNYMWGEFGIGFNGLANFDEE